MDTARILRVLSPEPVLCLPSPARTPVPSVRTVPVMTLDGTFRSRIFMLRACFTVFVLISIARAQWNEKVLYNFQSGTDGANPAGGVVFDPQGNLFGATQNGGSSSCGGPGQCGTVFELTPPVEKGGKWAETVLYIFQGRANKDGETPEGGIVIDAKGNLYGTTGYGGTGTCTLLGEPVGCGTVYELSPPAKQGDPWTETVLYSFQGNKDGYVPSGDIVFDDKGNLYGVTLFGGGKGRNCGDDLYPNCGTVWRLSPPKKKGGAWKEKVLHRFAGGKDGAWPNGGLVLDGAGAVYGTTFHGGYNCPYNSNLGCGTAFQLIPPTNKGGGWTEKRVHIFKNHKDGTEPNSGVILGPDGALYGGAGGGAKGGGVIYQLAALGGQWKETVVYEFNSNTDGYAPSVSFFNSKGVLYGTTNEVPDQAAGSVFLLNPHQGKRNVWTLAELYEFTDHAEGAFPFPQLAVDGSGRLYGATLEGGTSNNCSFQGCGVVFEVKP
ncbi:MAG: choice-of-anchor tandem repeat GloVer-containing protein [Terriglobales bacterium]